MKVFFKFMDVEIRSEKLQKHSRKNCDKCDEYVATDVYEHIHLIKMFFEQSNYQKLTESILVLTEYLCKNKFNDRNVFIENSTFDIIFFLIKNVESLRGVSLHFIESLFRSGSNDIIEVLINLDFINLLEEIINHVDKYEFSSVILCVDALFQCSYDINKKKLCNIVTPDILRSNIGVDDETDEHILSVLHNLICLEPDVKMFYFLDQTKHLFDGKALQQLIECFNMISIKLGDVINELLSKSDNVVGFFIGILNKKDILVYRKAIDFLKLNLNNVSIDNNGLENILSKFYSESETDIIRSLTIIIDLVQDGYNKFSSYFSKNKEFLTRLLSYISRGSFMIKLYSGICFCYLLRYSNLDFFEGTINEETYVDLFSLFDQDLGNLNYYKTLLIESLTEVLRSKGTKKTISCVISILQDHNIIEVLENYTDENNNILSKAINSFLSEFYDHYEYSDNE